MRYNLIPFTGTNKLIISKSSGIISHTILIAHLTSMLTSYLGAATFSTSLPLSAASTAPKVCTAGNKLDQVKEHGEHADDTNAHYASVNNYKSNHHEQQCFNKINFLTRENSVCQLCSPPGLISGKTKKMIHGSTTPE